MPQTFPSHVSLSDDTKTKLIAKLNTALATSIDLQLQVKQAHWNIKGPQFFARHELFDKLAMRLTEGTDSLAERAGTLGGYAMGTVRAASKASKLNEYNFDATDGTTHIRTLVDRYATYTKLLRTLIAEAEELSDPVTADLYTEILRISELDLWFLESHLHGSD